VTIIAKLVAPPLTLDQLVALSDELAALARAGVPLDRGLRDLAFDLPGRLGALAGQVGERLERGEPLERVVAELGASLPPAYRTVIAAGQRAGRLPLVLEEVARTARRISQLRRSLGLSLIYPLIVLALTWSMLGFVLTKIAPQMLLMMDDVGLGASPMALTLRWLQQASGWVVPAIAIVLFLWGAWIWIRSGRVARGVELSPWLGFGAIATLARMQRAGRIASLSELLALLVNHETPLPEAVELASAALGSPQMERGGRELATMLRRGEPLERLPAGFPPLVAWTLVSSHSPEQLTRALRRMADVHREEQTRGGQWLALYVPLVMTLGVGGTVVLAYALITLLPWFLILYRLAEPA
jgi:general secretion pathway protein F